MTDIVTALRRFIVDEIGVLRCPLHRHEPVEVDRTRPGRGTRPFEVRDHFGADFDLGSWVFQERLLARVEGASSAEPLAQVNPCALVLQHRGSWTAPNEHNTMMFPRIALVYYADPDRDSLGHVRDPLTARDRILAAHDAVDFYLHRLHFSGARIIGREDEDPGVRVIRCTRLGELDFAVVPEGDGVLSAQVFYALGVG